MRISEHFQLDRTQPTLDFVDVDVTDDVPLFVDPRALRRLPSQWGDECVSLIQHFFRAVIAAIKAGDDHGAQHLLGWLREPNETHLGLSRGRSRGRAVGANIAEDLWRELSMSEAARSGLLEDLEDTILMVEGVAADIVSDIATNIIREPLIHYTQDACRAYGIPLTADVDSGPLWNPSDQSWNAAYVDLPTIDGVRLLLVPKAIIRRRLDYDAAEYYRHYIIEHLRQEEFERHSELVKLLKDGRPRITIKSLKEKYGSGKQMIVRQTLRNPELLRRYRSDKIAISPAMSHFDIAMSSGSPTPDWDSLLDDVMKTPVGRPDADRYEKGIEKLLSALFYPFLTNPILQHEIHEGRKRIDITYTNIAADGLFFWIGQHFSAAQVFIECKNYGREIENPELDQLAGRFSPSRGQFGLLVCRNFENKELFMQRCIDTAHDQRGFIVPVDDGDLHALVQAAKVIDPAERARFQILHDRFVRLIND
jgi:hypothetical protein